MYIGLLCGGWEYASLGLFAVYTSLSGKNGDFGSNLLSHIFRCTAFIHNVSCMPEYTVEFLEGGWSTRLAAIGSIVLFWGLNTGGGRFGSNGWGLPSVTIGCAHRVADVPF